MKMLSVILLYIAVGTQAFGGELRIWDKSSANFVKNPRRILESDPITSYLVLKLDGNQFSVQECTTRPSKVFKLKSLNAALKSDCSLKYRDTNFEVNHFLVEASKEADVNLGTRKWRGLAKGAGAAVLGTGTVLSGLLTGLAITGGITAPMAAFFGPLTAGGATTTYLVSKSAKYDLTMNRKVSQTQISEIVSRINSKPNENVSFLVDDYKYFADSFLMLLDRI